MPAIWRRSRRIVSDDVSSAARIVSSGQCVEVHAPRGCAAAAAHGCHDIRRPLGRYSSSACANIAAISGTLSAACAALQHSSPIFFENQLHHGIFILQSVSCASSISATIPVRHLCALQKRLRLLHSGGMRHAETRLLPLQLLRNIIPESPEFSFSITNMPPSLRPGRCFPDIPTPVSHPYSPRPLSTRLDNGSERFFLALSVADHLDHRITPDAG